MTASRLSHVTAGTKHVSLQRWPGANAPTAPPEAYLWAVAEDYRDFGFGDLPSFLKAQHEAKEGLGG
jgi:hypothetical protein